MVAKKSFVARMLDWIEKAWNWPHIRIVQFSFFIAYIVAMVVEIVTGIYSISLLKTMSLITMLLVLVLWVFQSFELRICLKQNKDPKVEASVEKILWLCSVILGLMVAKFFLLQAL